MPFTIREISHAEVAPLTSAMRRESVTATELENTTWLGAFTDDGRLVGIVALSLLTPAHGRLKSDYVLPAYRGQGVYADLFAARMELARRSGCQRLTAFCTRYSIGTFLRAGFTAGKKGKSGQQFVMLTLPQSNNGNGSPA